MYCVKFTLRGAKTAAYTLVRVNIRCAASETAASFGFNLLLCQIEMCVFIGHLVVDAFIHTGFLTSCRIIRRICKVVLVERCEIATVTAYGHRSVGAYMAM